DLAFIPRVDAVDDRAVSFARSQREPAGRSALERAEFHDRLIGRHLRGVLTQPETARVFDEPDSDLLVGNGVDVEHGRDLRWRGTRGRRKGRPRMTAPCVIGQLEDELDEAELEPPARSYETNAFTSLTTNPYSASARIATRLCSNSETRLLLMVTVASVLTL